MHTLAVAVSGTGRHLENLARLSQSGELDARIGLVIATREKIAALDRAARFDLEAVVLDPSRELDTAAFSERFFAAADDAGADTVVLAGFLRKLALPERWQGRILNVHPSLLPAFGGKGYWGERVHAAVLESGCEISGCTVHYVDDEYDHGPVLLQRSVAVEPGDTVDTLASRVFAEELIALPEALRRHFARTR